jgi:hypothetical protein
MLTLVVNLLIWLLIAVIVFWAAKWIMAEAEVGEPVRKIVLLVLLILFLIVLINAVAGGPMWGPVVRVG